ncbi:MAG: 2-hydroxyacid dehydrogenase [Pseudomonadales bacterium]
MKVLFHYDTGEKLRSEVAQLHAQGLDVVCCPEGPPEPFNAEVVDAEVIWHVLHPSTADVIERAPALKLIQKIGVGVNTIDLEAAQARGIAVCNMPGTNSRAVAEMTLLLMLSALRKQPAIERACRSGQWTVDGTTRESLGEIGGRTVGFIGFGAVPRILAPMVEAMDARVIYTANGPKAVGYDFLPLDALLAQADIVSLHIPLTSATEQLIDRPRLASMKPGALLINTARGPLVDEQALYEALTDGNLGGAGLDVFYQEPVAADNPLLSLDNITVAPHVAWLTNETFSRSINIAVKNSLAVRDASTLVHRIV